MNDADFQGHSVTPADASVGSTSNTEVSFGREILRKAYSLLMLIIISWTITHKLEAIKELVEKVLAPAARSWRRVITFGMTLLFVYFLLRLLEDVLLRVLIAAIIMTALCAGSLSWLTGIFDPKRNSPKRLLLLSDGLQNAF